MAWALGSCMRNGNMNFAPNPSEIPSALGASPASSTHPVARLMDTIGKRTAVCFRVVFADRSMYQNREGQPAFTVIFKTIAAQRRALTFGHVGVLESYFDGSIDIDGHLQLAFRAAFDSGF